ncbi:hypothetical protein BWI75_01585 [Gloeocapsopsis sp. AAB1 = 1H9]|uniref:Uncharacterized protein n=1 Tax=Gloeocapsopsis dulcis AAB1 = 1H9 TaxID=1433147 RepID=A0A6N8FRX1_9CHRO|nr:hypothetical protein [Gloeocapsopsis dulcis AAB1 = 1H9]
MQVFCATRVVPILLLHSFVIVKSPANVAIALFFIHPAITVILAGYILGDQACLNALTAAFSHLVDWVKLFTRGEGYPINKFRGLSIDFLCVASHCLLHTIHFFFPSTLTPRSSPLFGKKIKLAIKH